jgi:hypothetical protein
MILGATAEDELAFRNFIRGMILTNREAVVEWAGEQMAIYQRSYRKEVDSWRRRAANAIYETLEAHESITSQKRTSVRVDVDNAA